MAILLADTQEARSWMVPFAATRPLGTIRNGILTQQERWEKQLSQPICLASEAFLGSVYALTDTLNQGDTIINASWVATPEAAGLVAALKPGEVLSTTTSWLAFRTAKAGEGWPLTPDGIADTQIQLPDTFIPQLVERPWHLYLQAKQTTEADFDLLTAGRTSEPVNDAHTAVYNPARVFIEPGCKIRAAVLNAEAGCIYLGKNAQVQEGALLAGTLALCEGSTANMGVKLRGDNIIGPHCKVGGEIANSILFGYSNKGHDGYLGNSVLGEWCNLGADTNTSNLKNNYTNVKITLGPPHGEVDTGQLFCGLLMGDHGKAGINTMFNTGTVVEVGCNVFGGGYMPKHLPPFSWGGEDLRFENHAIEKMIETERRVLARRKVELSAAYADLLRYLAGRATSNLLA